jgi:hypothetical protein
VDVSRDVPGLESREKILEVHQKTRGPAMTPTRALIEAAERAKLLLRGLTVSEVMGRGTDAINAVGLNPWCVNEGRASGQELISTDWLDDAISSAKAAEEGVETKPED